MTPMALNDRKDLFSRAYVRAVASVAGYMATVPELDRESVDLQLAGVGGGGTVRSPYLDLQLKCTGADSLTPGTFGHPLKVKNYNDLRATNLSVPKLLVVVAVPTNIGQWLATSEQELVMRHCGYWRSLHGEPSTANTANITVTIDRANQFDVVELEGIMATISAGGTP